MIVVEVAGGVVVIVLAYILIGLSAMFFAPLSGIFGRFPYRVRTSQRVLALTFDDGPNLPYTSRLLDILKKHDVRATFFLVGKNAEHVPDIGRRMVAEGHVIGNHTYSHSFSSYFSKAKLRREIEQTQSVIKTITGIEPTLFRPPWLFRWPWIFRVAHSFSLTPISAEFGYEFEVIHQHPEAIARRALAKAYPGVIMDFHDGYDAKGGYRQGTVEAIDLLIPKLKSAGYSFVTVDELLPLTA